MVPREAVYVLATLSMVLSASAHGDDETPTEENQKTYPTTYFTSDTPQLAIKVHIALMILSWFIILPMTTMLAIARSRYTRFLRLALTATNIIGVLFGVSYKAKTPDLYPGSAHSAVGWIVTAIAAAQMSHLLIGPVTNLLNRVTGRDEYKADRYAPNSMRQGYNSLPSHGQPPSLDLQATHIGMEDDHDTSSDAGLYQEDPHESGFSSSDDTFYGDSDSKQHDPTAKPFSKAILMRSLRLMYNVMDRAILIVAFVAFCTGIATFWGLFKGKEVFNGIAHWIKGGIFFWLGIFYLGRWCGSFAELGWAWNIRPDSSKRKQPAWTSPEFVESSLIFVYGSTNIFLEHLAGWGKAWSARDLEHIAITILFIGGGLCGMLVEYIRVKGLGKQKASPRIPTWTNGTTDERDENETKGNGISLNPLPALVIFLMGGSMASHEQASMVSSMVHKQWGNLLGAASIARLLTYVIMYLKPPTTAPSRPPTELLMSFCLISGGILFMASSRDTIEGMIHFEIDAMALYTVTMGFTGIIMAWIIALLALKDRASR